MNREAFKFASGCSAVTHPDRLFVGRWEFLSSASSFLSSSAVCTCNQIKNVPACCSSTVGTEFFNTDSRQGSALSGLNKAMAGANARLHQIESRNLNGIGLWALLVLLQV